MIFRWTIKDLQTKTDAEILRGLVAERQSELHPYSPLNERLQRIYNNLDKEIQTRREAEKAGFEFSGKGEQPLGH